MNVASRIPIRWRLTLWYAGLLAMVIVLFSLTLYVGLRQILYSMLDESLHQQAALVASTIQVVNGVPDLPGSNARDFTTGEHFVRLTDLSGRTVDGASSVHGRLPVDQAGLSQALSGRFSMRWVSTDGEQMRVLSEPVVSGGQIVGALQVGTSGTEVVETLQFTVLLLAIAGSLILLAASLGGLWIAGRVLQPVDRITGLAAEIEETDLSRRINLNLPDDQIGRLARTFNGMLDRIEGAFRRQHQFTADASHELRTPLTLMQNQIELALRQPRDPEEDRAVLEALAGDLDRLTRLANALLLLARGDDHAIRLHHEAVDLPVVLGLIAEQYGPVAAEAGVTFRLDTEPAMPRADQDRVIQVLVNLVDNALRHSPAGTEIVLGCRTDDAWASFWVIDQGAGIAPEHLPHLGERFYRIEQDRDRARGGIGLGLSICKMIIAAYGGTMAITSSPGTGTSVVVRLPALTAPSEGLAPERKKASAPSATLASTGLQTPARRN
ncbi:sensor histidine kinase [Nitrolancea hollandica]|uniref:histidine kinase n=1 Tax=Nitrolancea hollandica Lb TaxID=1129897 RepID=I4ED75_9BACT|nr:ATP-binding protein [Nitrolancea hollandica]CCF82637.1 putative Sensor protein [Nitrolancea hollandica Lb]